MYSVILEIDFLKIVLEVLAKCCTLGWGGVKDRKEGNMREKLMESWDGQVTGG